MDADRVVVPERLAHGVDRRERDLGGGEGVHSRVRRAPGVSGAADEARRLADAAVVRVRNAHRPVLRARRRVDHHRQVHVAEVAEP